MATITGLTAERMFEIEAATVVGGEIVGDHLILHKQDGSTVDTGPFPPGPIGPAGPAGGMIPGEVKLWSGTALPDPANYGKWVWADGATYDVATYPKAAAAIAPGWRTFAGASDPPAALFRVPDLRGLVPAGLDQMPGGTRANRVTRAVSIVIASKTGEEIHVITTPEMPTHTHGIYDPGHVHTDKQYVNLGSGNPFNGVLRFGTAPTAPVTMLNPATTGIVVQNAGSNNAHENMQPTVFVPYIVKLD